MTADAEAVMAASAVVKMVEERMLVDCAMEVVPLARLISSSCCGGGSTEYL